MFSVALIGPDGSGKTTIARRLEHTLPVRAKYLYMGVNLDASNHMLPTTRLLRALKRMCGARPDVAGPPDPDRAPPPAAGLARRAARSVRAGLGLANRVAEEAYRQALARYYEMRGYVVLFDRHFMCDYHAYDIAATGRRRTLASRIHGYMVQHVCACPDLVIYLDAPAEVLFRRKGEGTVALLERRRNDYLRLQGVVRNFVVVDACQSADAVAYDVAQHITAFLGARSLHAAERV